MASRVRWLREFAQIDREDRARGHGNDEADQGRHQRAGYQRHDAETGVLEHRGPLGVGQEIDDRDLAEEQDGIVDAGCRRCRQ